MANYNGVNYDPNTDYMAQIKQTSDPLLISALSKARDAKMMSMSSQNNNPAQVVKDAITSTKTGQYQGPANINTGITVQQDMNLNGGKVTNPTTESRIQNENNNIKKEDQIIDTGNAGKTYADGVKDANEALKAGQTGMTLEQYEARETQRLEAQKQSAIARVKAAIAQGVQGQNKIIADAPAQFVNPMNNASYQGARNSQAIDERMAAMGLGRSGANVTAQTSNANQTSANINELEAAKAKVISDAQAAIANLQASGSMEEVAIIQDLTAKSLDRIQQQMNYIEQRDSGYNKDNYTATVDMLKSNYDISQNDQTRTDAQYASQGLVYDPITKKYVQSQAGRQAEATYDSTKAGIDATKTSTEGQKITNSFLTDKYLQELALGERQITRADLDNMTAEETLKVLPEQLQQNLKQSDLQNAGLEISNKIQQLNLEALPEQIKMNLKKIIQDLEKGDLENAALKINNKYLPDQLKAQIQDIYASTAGKYANISQGWKSLDIQQQNANTSESIRKDTLELNRDTKATEKLDKQDQTMYNNTFESMIKLYGKAELDASGEKVIGYKISDEDKGKIRDQIVPMLKSGKMSERVADQLGLSLGIN